MKAKHGIEFTIVEKLRVKVENEHKGFLGMLNEGMGALFFDIGILINRDLQNDYNVTVGEISTKEFADKLYPVFGNYLSAENLTLMTILANKWNSEKIRYSVSIINWEYLPYFLNLKEEDEWIFYAELIYTESLTPSSLKKKIFEKTYEKALKMLNADRHAFMLVKTNTIYQSTHELYFGNQYLENFRTLFKPQVNGDETVERLLRNDYVHKDTISEIYKKIVEFQIDYNHLLNTQFNILFWFIGVEILRQSKSSSTQESDNLIDLCIQKLHIKFPSIFNKEELTHCVQFVKQYGEDAPPPMEIVQTVSWPYIKLLLKIDQIEKQKQIANEVLNNGMSIENLKFIIENNFLDFKSTGERLLKNSTKKDVVVSKITEKNFTAVGKIETIEPNIHPKYDLNRNIFKVPELLIFLATDIYTKD